METNKVELRAQCEAFKEAFTEMLKRRADFEQEQELVETYVDGLFRGIDSELED